MNWDWLRTLAHQGCHVVALLMGQEHVPADLLTEARIQVVRIDAQQFPATLTLSGPNDFPLLHQSDQVRFALEKYHETHAFDVIEFDDNLGLAFRSVQAKRLGLAFGDVPLVVRHEPHRPQDRREHHQWPDQPDDLAQDYCEQYAFDHADPNPAEGMEKHLRPRSTQLRKGDTVREAPPLVTVCVAYYNLGPYLEEALASLAAQTYPALEVILINDGSTDLGANQVFEQLRHRHPQFHFVSQENAGIGATRNRGLAMARGEYFLPMDADNIARPDMIAKLVTGLQKNRDLAALTSYFLAFQESAEIKESRFLYSYKPTGGPRILGCLRNVYGDGNALFRVAPLRAIGGFSTDRNASWEDWELFAKLNNAGHALDVVPEYLFYYRHRDAGFSRMTDHYHNYQRVLRQYVAVDHWPREDRLALWNLLAGMNLRLKKLTDENKTLTTILRSKRYQVVDTVGAALDKVPGWRSTMNWLWERWRGKQSRQVLSLTKPCKR